jgi:hypothetical protein
VSSRLSDAGPLAVGRIFSRSLKFSGRISRSSSILFLLLHTPNIITSNSVYAMSDGSSTHHLNFETTDEDDSRTLDPLRANDLEQVLKLTQAKNWTLGTFLYDLFSVPKVQKKDGNPQTQTQMVSIFLQGRSKIKAPDIVEMMYASRYSAPSLFLWLASRLLAFDSSWRSTSSSRRSSYNIFTTNQSASPDESQ